MQSRLGTYPASSRAAATVHRVNCSARRSNGDLSQVLSAATPFLRCGGKDQPGRGSRSSHPRSAARGPVGLTEVCVEAVLEARSNLLGPTSADEVILGYKRVQGGFGGASVGKEVAKEESDVLHKRRKIPIASLAPSSMCPFAGLSCGRYLPSSSPA
jgi:hypothetical protein